TARRRERRAEQAAELQKRRHTGGIVDSAIEYTVTIAGPRRADTEVVPMRTINKCLVRLGLPRQPAKHILRSDALVSDSSADAQRCAREQHRLELAGLS